MELPNIVEHTTDSFGELLGGNSISALILVHISKGQKKIRKIF
jgi:hypothetical protein